MNLDDLHEDVRVGRDARALLMHLAPVVGDLLRKAETALFKTEPHEAAQREELYRHHRALQAVLGELSSRKADGEDAEKTIASLNQRGLHQR